MKLSKTLLILSASAMAAMSLTACEPKQEVIVEAPAEPMIDPAELARMEREAKIEAAREAIAAQQGAQSPAATSSSVKVTTQAEPQTTQVVTSDGKAVTPDTNPEAYRRPEDKNLIRRSDGPPPQQ